MIVANKTTRIQQLNTGGGSSGSSTNSERISVSAFNSKPDGVRFWGTIDLTNRTVTGINFTPNDTGKVVYIDYLNAVEGGLTAYATYVNSTTISLVDIGNYGSWANLVSYMATYKPNQNVISQVLVYIGSDNLSAFQAAVDSTQGEQISGYSHFPSYPGCVIDVPSGIYLLSGYIQPRNMDIVWSLLTGAWVCPSMMLSTRTHSHDGHKIEFQYNGVEDHAVGLTIMRTGNSLGSWRGAAFNGYSEENQMYIGEEIGPGLISGVMTGSGSGPVVASCTFTATSFTPATPLTLAQQRALRIGTIVETHKDAYSTNGVKYRAVVKGWNADYSIIQTGPWSRWDTGSVPNWVTPPNGPKDVVINPITKVWGQNTWINLTSGGYCDLSSGYEIDMFNQRGAYDHAGGRNMMWGFDAATFGAPYKVAAGFIARGTGAGFYSCFCVPSYTVGNYGFLSEGKTDWHIKTPIFSVPGTASDAALQSSRVWVNKLQVGGSDTSASPGAGPSPAGGIMILSGLGSPEGVVKAQVGSLYLRTDGATNTTLYIKESGAYNVSTGWVAK